MLVSAQEKEKATTKMCLICCKKAVLIDIYIYIYFPSVVDKTDKKGVWGHAALDLCVYFLTKHYGLTNSDI